MSALYQEASALLRSGGPIMLPLLFVGVLVNFLLVLRFLTLLGLRREIWKTSGFAKHSRKPISFSKLWKQQHQEFSVSDWNQLELQLHHKEAMLRRDSTIINALITAAPLLGLLGTVSGMILTFDALGDMSMFRQGGGIAGGISEAFLTTQLGLGIAMPALLVQRLLDRWNQRWLQRVEEWLMCCRKAQEPKP